MRTMIKRFLFLLVTALLTTQTAFAQNADEQLTQTLRGSGLFNVIIACIAIVLLGLLIAIIRLDRKVSKLEKEHQARQS
jgi:hypothetical protein